MARKQSRTLTDGEVRIMEVVWELGSASVRDVHERIARDRVAGDDEPAYNTVQTMMGILERKGVLSRSKVGRAFVYEPLVSRAQARSQALQHVLGRFFGSSPQALLQNLLDEEELDAVQIERMRRLLEESSGGEGSGR